MKKPQYCKPLTTKHHPKLEITNGSLAQIRKLLSYLKHQNTDSKCKIKTNLKRKKGTIHRKRKIHKNQIFCCIYHCLRNDKTHMNPRVVRQCFERKEGSTVHKTKREEKRRRNKVIIRSKRDKMQTQQ